MRSAVRLSSAFNSRLFVSSLVFTLLCGCSDGPSASDIKSALQAFGNVLFGPNTGVVEDVTNVNCHEAQSKPGYACSFTATVFSNVSKTRSSTTNEGRFIKSDSGWQMMPDR